MYCRTAAIVSIIPALLSGCVPGGSLEDRPRGNTGVDDKLQLLSRDELARRVMRPLVEYGPGFGKNEAKPFNHKHAVNKLKKLFKLKWKLYGKPSTTRKPPTSTKPSTTTKQPTTTSKPSTTKQPTTTSKPSTTKKPSTTTSKPTTTTSKAITKKVTTTTTKPPTARKVTTATKKASTKATDTPPTKGKPSTRKPSTITTKSKIINKTVTSFKVIVNSKNKKQTGNA